MEQEKKLLAYPLFWSEYTKHEVIFRVISFTESFQQEKSLLILELILFYHVSSASFFGWENLYLLLNGMYKKYLFSADWSWEMGKLETKQNWLKYFRILMLRMYLYYCVYVSVFCAWLRRSRQRDKTDRTKKVGKVDLNFSGKVSLLCKVDLEYYIVFFVFIVSWMKKLNLIHASLLIWFKRIQ